MQWTLLESADQVAEKACERILSAAAEAIGARGGFHLVLAGGATPRRTYEMLAQGAGDWAHWHIYFGDERCLPRQDPERNSRMAEQALTSRVPIPPEQIHPIPAELGPVTAAGRYQQTIAQQLPFDLVLLGMGEDGHTASLFPGQQYAPEPLTVAVFDAPKPPPERVSLNYATLGNCRSLLCLITGEGKRDAVGRWRSGAALPISRIQPRGRGEVLIDRPAAAGLYCEKTLRFG